MLKYILKRILQSIPVIFFVITATFFMIRFAPGGPFDKEKAIPEEILKRIEEKYHLNDPLWRQYLDYLGGLLQGDLGPSYTMVDRSVNELIASGLPITFELGLYAILFALFFGASAGLFAGLRPNTKWDYIPMSASMVGICLPTFLLGPVLVLIFGILLEWLPVSGWEAWQYKILPSVTLGASYAAYVARLSRGGMLEIMSQDYIRTARAKGVSERAVVLRHALRGAVLPIVAFLGPATAGLLAGSFVVETIFQIPGMGRLYVKASFNRDYMLIMDPHELMGGWIPRPRKLRNDSKSMTCGIVRVV